MSIRQALHSQNGENWRPTHGDLLDDGGLHQMQYPDKRGDGTSIDRLSWHLAGDRLDGDKTTLDAFPDSD